MDLANFRFAARFADLKAQHETDPPPPGDSVLYRHQPITARGVSARRQHKLNDRRLPAAGRIESQREGRGPHMPVSPLDGPPFRGRHAAALTRIVGTVRTVLDPDSVEMEYLFEPSGQRFRWRALRSRVFTPGSVRPARRHPVHGGVPGRGIPPDGPPPGGAHAAPRATEAMDAAGGPALRGLPAASRPAPRERGGRRNPRGGPPRGWRARPRPRPRRSFSSGRRAPSSTRTAPPRRSSRPAARSSSSRETAARPRSRPGLRAWGREPPLAKSGPPSSPTAGRSRPRSHASPTRRKTTSPFSR